MADPLADLPDEVRELIDPQTDALTSDEMLAAISLAIAKKRDEAKTSRKSSGIEAVWMEAEEAYIGIDDANRHEFQDSKWAKPMSSDGPVTTGKANRNTDHKSTVFVRLTARYVDAGAAKLGEILLPIDDKAFSFTETPVPELIQAKEDTSQVVHDGMGNAPLMRPAKPGEVAPAGSAQSATGSLPPQASPQTPVPASAAVSPQQAGAAGQQAQAQLQQQQQVPLTVKDLAEENIQLARKKAKQAEKRIADWMVESKYPAEMRKVIFDAARIGVGILKGPYPKSCKAMKASKDGSGIGVEIVEKIAPAYTWVDPWNIFPDPACGENIHDGDFVFDRDYLSARQVRALKKLPGYIGSAIDKVLEEGPEKSDKSDDQGRNGRSSLAERKGRYEVWYYYGSMKREELDCLSTAAGTKLDTNSGDKDQIYAIVTMINSTIVKWTPNPLDSGCFPYNSVPWQRRSGHWAGIGVSEQLRTPQRMLNAATRAMLNNAGKSAGSQVVVDLSAIAPIDGSWAMTPDKFWGLKSDAATDDVNKAFRIFELPNVTPQLMTIINYSLQLAEESTSIPLVTQGQTGPTTPETFGATQLQDSNANQLLRSIGYAFDDYITEPVVRQSYEWLLLDPDVPDEEKGDFNINAHGSAALVERAIQDQFLAQMGNLVTNVAFGINPKLWMKMTLKSKRLDPTDLQYTEEEQAKIDAAPPPVAPAVQVAQINAQTETTKIAAQQQTSDRSIQNEQQIAAAANELSGHQTLTDATVRLHEMEGARQLAMLDYANRHQMNLDQVKAQLAKTAMQLSTERELNAMNNDADHAKAAGEPNPPVQAPGRAANGEAFSQSQ